VAQAKAHVAETGYHRRDPEIRCLEQIIEEQASKQIRPTTGRICE